MNKIDKATDWASICSELRGSVRNVGYNPDLEKMLKNIDGMVSELSKLEVESRRIHRPTIAVTAQVDKVNQAIVTVEQWLMLAALAK